MTPLLITNARILDPFLNRDETAPLYLDASGHIAPIPATLPSDTRRINAAGLTLTPGLWDLHAHFREAGVRRQEPEAGKQLPTPNSPLPTVSETIATGSRAAAAGGFTHVVTMPNTTPPCDNIEAIERSRTQSNAVEILPAACVTLARAGRLVADLPALTRAGAVAFTDDGNMVSDPAVMRQALLLAKTLNRVVMDHAVLPGAGMAYASAAQKKFAWQEFAAASEVEAVRQDIELAQQTGAALHVQHLSCGESIKQFRDLEILKFRDVNSQIPKSPNPQITCEVTPHHLFFTCDDIPGDDPAFKMNPPLGTPADRDALLNATLRGDITCLATDHAPHTAESKSRGFLNAPFGVIGLETAVAATWQVLVLRHGMAPLKWLSLWTTAPAKILGLPPPSLTPGTPANLTLLDLKNPWLVDPSRFHSLSRNCPFAGHTLTGRAVLTICNGRVTHDAH